MHYRQNQFQLSALKGHDQDQLNVRLVWAVVEDDLPALIATINGLLGDVPK